MGCDIHTVVQVKAGDEWVSMEREIFDGRSYAMFGALAGVRSYYPKPAVEITHSFPDDFVIEDEEYHNGYWMGEHSHGYVTLENLQKWMKKQKRAKRRWEIYEMEDNGLITVIIPKLEELAEKVRVKPDEIRLVFGFDS